MGVLLLDWIGQFVAWLTKWGNFWKVLLALWLVALGIFAIDWYLRRQDRKEDEG